MTSPVAESVGLYLRHATIRSVVCTDTDLVIETAGGCGAGMLPRGESFDIEEAPPLIFSVSLDDKVEDRYLESVAEDLISWPDTSVKIGVIGSSMLLSAPDRVPHLFHGVQRVSSAT